MRNVGQLRERQRHAGNTAAKLATVRVNALLMAGNEKTLEIRK